MKLNYDLMTLNLVISAVTAAFVVLPTLIMMIDEDGQAGWEDLSLANNASDFELTFVNSTEFDQQQCLLITFYEECDIVSVQHAIKKTIHSCSILFVYKHCNDHLRIAGNELQCPTPRLYAEQFNLTAE